MALNSMEMGTRIRAARLARGLSPSELASLVNISPKYLERIEKGRRTPSLDVFVLLAEALDSTLDDLISTPRSRPASQLDDLLSDCTPKERDFLLALLTAAKSLLLVPGGRFS